LFPDRLPSIEDAPWKDIGLVRGLMIMSVTVTANLVKPDVFFWSQLITNGQSDLKDFELIYMSPTDAIIYFLFESLFLPWMTFNSLTFISVFWYLYAAEITWGTLEFLADFFVE